MKKLLVLMLVGLLVTSLAVAVSAVTVKLNVIEGLAPPYQSAIDQYFAVENPDIEVEITGLGWGDHHDALITALVAGQGAGDVEAIDVGFISKFVAEGGFVDLNAAYNAIDIAGDIVKFSLDLCVTAAGEMVAFPVDIAPCCMFWRPSVFADAGIDIAAIAGSWEDYIEVGKQLTGDADGDGVNDHWMLADAGDIALAYLEGGRTGFVDADGNVLVLNDSFVRATTLAKMARDAGIDGIIGAWSNDWYASFREGTCATCPSGAWLQGHLATWIAPETAGDWGVVNLPGGSYASWGGSYLGIPEQSEHKDAAWKVIKFLCLDPRPQLIALEEHGIFPALTTTYTDPCFVEPVDFFGGQMARMLWAHIAQNIGQPPVSQYDAIGDTVYKSVLAEVLNEGVPVDAALHKVAEVIKSLL